MISDLEIRFNEGDTLAALSQRVRGAYDAGERRILIACEDYTFPDAVAMGGMWEKCSLQWVYVLSQAFQQVGGLPSGEFRAVANPNYLQGSNYPMCLEYRVER